MQIFGTQRAWRGGVAAEGKGMRHRGHSAAPPQPNDDLRHRGHGGDTEFTEEDALLGGLWFELCALCDEIEILAFLAAQHEPRTV